MPTDHGPSTDELMPRALTRQEIDDRMQHVAGVIATGTEDLSRSDASLDPRWISAAELVRRVRPFLVYN